MAYGGPSASRGRITSPTVAGVPALMTSARDGHRWPFVSPISSETFTNR